MLFSIIVQAAIAAATPQPSFNEEGAFVCTPIYLWNAVGPLRCAEGPAVTLWGITETAESGCRDVSSCGRGNDATDQLIGRLNARASVGPNGYRKLSGATPINCLRVENDPDPLAALCSALPLDGVLVGGDDLACWLLKRRLAEVRPAARRFYARCLGQRGSSG